MNQPPNVTEEQVAAARLKIVLDRKLGRATPDRVRRIATMTSSQPAGTNDLGTLQPEPSHTLELTADVEQAPAATFRTIAGTLAMHAGFDDDLIEDVKSATDETYSALIALARQSGTLHWRFAITEFGLQIVAEVDSGDVDLESLDWRAVSDLTDEFTVGQVGRRVHVELTKHRTQAASAERSQIAEVAPEGATPPLRVVVADGHPLFRTGLRELLDGEPGIRVVGEVSTGSETVSAASILAPDVIVLDPRMWHGKGGEGVKSVLDAQPGTAVLVLTMYEDDKFMLAPIRAGARGHLLREADPDDIVRAVRAVGAGEVIFSPAVARRIMGYTSTPIEPVAAESSLPQLSEREREVLQLMASGQSTAQIGHKLLLSPRTLRNYISSIRTKIQGIDPPRGGVGAREVGLGGPASGESPSPRET